MRLLYLLVFLVYLTATARAQPASWSAPPNTSCTARDTFDPTVHALGRLRAGAIEFLVDPRVLVKSLRVMLPELDRVEGIEKQQIDGIDFLVFMGWLREASYRRYLVAVRLRHDGEGYLFADYSFDICIALDDDVCSDCILTADGCRCWANGDAFCGNQAGKDIMVFSKVSTRIE